MSGNLSDALARIDWQGRQRHLGVDLVNHDRERFFLYAEPFVCMMGRPDEYVIVKRRDRDPDKAIHHHGGAIWGDVDVNGECSTISLYYGALYKDIVYCPDNNGLINVIGKQQYRIETEWLQYLVKTIERHHDEQREFDRLIMEADVTPLQASFSR